MKTEITEKIKKWILLLFVRILWNWKTFGRMYTGNKWNTSRLLSANGPYSSQNVIKCFFISPACLTVWLPILKLRTCSMITNGTEMRGKKCWIKMEWTIYTDHAHYVHLPNTVLVPVLLAKSLWPIKAWTPQDVWRCAVVPGTKMLATDHWTPARWGPHWSDLFLQHIPRMLD